MTTLERLKVANAAGMVKRPEDVEKLLDSAVTRIVVGSLTKEPRDGNLGETYYYDPATKTAWNSKGLNNRGVFEATSWLQAMRDAAFRKDKQLAVSIAGFSPTEYAELSTQVARFVDSIELNLGCPNVQKPIVSYDPEAVREVLQKVALANRFGRSFSVKLSPVEDELVGPLSDMIQRFSFVDEVIVCNTRPNQSGTRTDGSPALAFQASEGGEVKHAGGMSGAQLKPDRRRLTRAFREKLPERVKVFACGGIDSGQDVLDSIEDGAAGIMVGTHFFEHGPRVFSEILQEAAQ